MVERYMVGLSMVGMGGQSLAGVSRWQGSVTDPPWQRWGGRVVGHRGGIVAKKHSGTFHGEGLSMVRDFPW